MRFLSPLCIVLSPTRTVCLSLPPYARCGAEAGAAEVPLLIPVLSCAPELCISFFSPLTPFGSHDLLANTGGCRQLCDAAKWQSSKADVLCASFPRCARSHPTAAPALSSTHARHAFALSRVAPWRSLSWALRAPRHRPCGGEARWPAPESPFLGFLPCAVHRSRERKAVCAADCHTLSTRCVRARVAAGCVLAPRCHVCAVRCGARSAVSVCVGGVATSARLGGRCPTTLLPRDTCVDLETAACARVAPDTCP